MASEKRIDDLIARGDVRGAATEAIRAFGPRILGYLHAILRDEADAGEAFSIFAESLWRGLPSFRGECAFRTWAYKLAWNAALRLRDDAYRRRGRRLGSTEASRLAEEIRTRSAVRRERQSAALDRLRAGLTPAEQSLLVLRIDQRLPWEDVAAVLSAPGEAIDPAMLRKRFERLKERLARRAREEGLVE
ncbi:MAG TPA: sigma-70 family RNA polymerase sigma factor [Anaeromyxobacteraceae bacterium]|nr:sigma-70 family RNA polymerase sigma factor [Anaeromyxobacteraceae bacterium]